MNILVTGGAGYIGSVTSEALIESGHRVVVLDNLSKGHRDAVHPKAELIVDQVGNRDTVNSIIKQYRIDAIMHFAADSLVGESMEKPDKYFSNNVAQGLELVKSAAENKIKKFVFSSTCATYGNPIEVPISETHPQNPANPYGESKLMVEKMLKWVNHAYGLDYVFLRYFNACGASEMFGEDHTPESHLIPLVLQVAHGEREEIQIFGDDYPTDDGTCIRDYIHVVDLAQAHILALDITGCGIYNLGNEQGFSVKEVIDTARKVTGCEIPTKIAPRRPGDPAVLIAHADKAKNELKWEPKYQSLETMIQTAWKWKLAHPQGYTA